MYLVEASEQKVSREASHSRGLHGCVARLRGPRLHPMNTATSVAAPTAIGHVVAVRTAVFICRRYLPIGTMVQHSRVRHGKAVYPLTQLQLRLCLL